MNKEKLSPEERKKKYNDYMKKYYSDHREEINQRRRDSYRERIDHCREISRKNNQAFRDRQKQLASDQAQPEI